MGPIRRVVLAVAALSASLSLVDCAPAARGSNNGASGTTNVQSRGPRPGGEVVLQSGPTVLGQVTAPTEATVVQARCDASAPESCNGLDDNCNGRIDEGCGYGSGGFQVTASWQSDADVNLTVTDPAGNEVSEGHNSPTGGALDQSANFNCVRSRPTLENAVWAAATPPRGRYEVKLTAFDMCSAQSAPVTVSISVGGRVLGTWRVELTYPRQEISFGVTVR
jgi:tRNA (guanosine-2'-O-)-methyltransferase